MADNKNRESKCEGCGTELGFDPVDPLPIAKDMMDFIMTQEHWAERNTPSIAWGMLSAVFRVIFDIAPNEKRAVQLIIDCLSEFVDVDSADA